MTDELRARVDSLLNDPDIGTSHMATVGELLELIEELEKNMRLTSPG